MSVQKFLNPENSTLAQGMLQIVLDNAFLIRKVDGRRNAAVMFLTEDQLSVLESFDFSFDELIYRKFDCNSNEITENVKCEKSKKLNPEYIEVDNLNERKNSTKENPCEIVRLDEFLKNFNKAPDNLSEKNS